MSLSIDTLFQHYPKLEEYLKEGYNEDLVNKVDLCCTSPWSLFPHADVACTQMSSAGLNQCSVHITYIQQDILRFLQPSNTQKLDLNVPARLSREEWGLASHITAWFLVPQQHLDTFEEDPAGYITTFLSLQGSPYTQGHC